jgi:hypothetical protein
MRLLERSLIRSLEETYVEKAPKEFLKVEDAVISSIPEGEVLRNAFLSNIGMTGKPDN